MCLSVALIYDFFLFKITGWKKCSFKLEFLALPKFWGKLFMHIFCRKMPVPIGLIDLKSVMNCFQWEMIFRIIMKEIHSKKRLT